MNRLAAIPLLFSVLTAATAALAATQSPAAPPSTPAGSEAAQELPAAVRAKIEAALKSRLSNVTVSQIHSTPLPGLYEILMPQGIAYVDESAEHMVMGQMYDTRTHQNLTMQRWDKLGAIDFSSLPFELAIKSTRGRGSRQVAVFEDPECPYCQQLEAELAKQDDITIYTFLFPLEDVHPGATKTAHRLWCAADRASAWSSWMIEHKLPPERDCTDDPIKELAALGTRLRINSTPTIFFRSGHRSSGMPAAAELQRLLNSESDPVVAAQAAARPSS